MDQKKSIIVGIFTCLLLVLVGLLILWKSDLRYRASGYKLVGTFENLGGLLKGADIRYRGYRVGRVSDVHPGPTEILVDIWIDKEIKIPVGSQAKILFNGLVGENYLSIELNLTEKTMLKHGDRIFGTTGSNLANFIDLGSQNMIHAEAILSSLKNLLTSNDTNHALKNIFLSFDTITEELGILLKEFNTGRNSKQFKETLNHFSSIAKTLDQATTDIFDDGNFSIQISKMAQNLATMSENIKLLTDKETMVQLKGLIANLEEISNSLSGMFSNGPQKKNYPLSGNLLATLSTLSNLEISTETSIQYTPETQQSFYAANIAFNFGGFFFNTGIGDRTGENKFLHFQQGIYLTENLATRIGLFYQKAGIGFDYKLTPRANFSIEIYDIKNLELDILSKIGVRKDLDVLLGLRKNTIDKTLNNVDLGLSYHF